VKVRLISSACNPCRRNCGSSRQFDARVKYLFH